MSLAEMDCNQIELTTALICSFAITHITNH